MKRTHIRILSILSALIILLSASLTVSAASADTLEAKTQRVSHGLLTGDIPDLEDVVEVVNAQLNSSLDDGITASIDEAGKLQFIQRLDKSRSARSNAITATVAVSTLMAVNESGVSVNDIWTNSGNLGSTSVYTVHNTYLNIYYDGQIGHPFEITCTRMSTKFQYNGSVTVSMFYHTFKGRQWAGLETTLQSGYTTAPILSNNTYSFYPTQYTYKNAGQGLIETSVHALIGSQTYTLSNTIVLAEVDWMMIIT